MRRRSAGVVALLLAITGCGGSSTHRTAGPSYDAAVARAQAVARETLTEVIGPGATMHDLRTGANPSTVPCTDAAAPPPDTPVDVAFSYAVVGADPARVDDYFTSFRAHWTHTGWRVLHGSRADDELTLGRYGYVVMLQLAPSNGLLSITAQTPCVPPKSPKDPDDY